MGTVPSELRELIEAGPLAHLSTINADGSPQVTVIWIGLDGERSSAGTCTTTASCATSNGTRGSSSPRLTKVYMSPDDEFPAPKGPGYIARYETERISGVGPWAQKPSG